MPEIEPEPAEVAECTRHLLDALAVLERHVEATPEGRKVLRKMRAGLRRLGRVAGRVLAENRRMHRALEQAEYECARLRPFAIRAWAEDRRAADRGLPSTPAEERRAFRTR